MNNSINLTNGHHKSDLINHVERELHEKNEIDLDNRNEDNNKKKFAFLAQQTIPDYRPQVV